MSAVPKKNKNLLRVPPFSRFMSNLYIYYGIHFGHSAMLGAGLGAASLGACDEAQYRLAMLLFIL